MSANIIIIVIVAVAAVVGMFVLGKAMDKGGDSQP